MSASESQFTFSKTLSFQFTDESHVIKRGRLAIMISQKIDSNADFETHYVQLTEDSCFTIRKIGNRQESKAKKFIVKQCSIMDDACLFRLEAISADEFENPVELLCRSKDKFLRNDWLISIESCIRQGISHLTTQVDSLRDYMEICVLDKDACIFQLDDLEFKGCFCYYHDKLFRVKEYYPNETLSYEIEKISYNVEDQPLCFLIKTSEVAILCRTDNADVHLLWSTYIQNDLDAGHKGSAPGEFIGLLLIKTETSSSYKRMHCKYTASTGLLEISDSCDNLETLKVLRCIVEPPKPDAKHHFTLLSHIKFANPMRENHLYCRAATTEDAEAWIEVFTPPMANVIKLIQLIIEEIEIRRTLRHETALSKQTRLTFEEINDLILHVENANMTIRDAIKCPLMTLEKALRTIFKFVPKPVIPFNIQNEFLTLGQQIKHTKIRKVDQSKIKALYKKIPKESQAILKILKGHVTQIINQNIDKCPEITVQEGEVFVWTRLSTNLCKIYQQKWTEGQREEFLDCVGHVLAKMLVQTDMSDSDNIGQNDGNKKKNCAFL